MKRQLYDTQSWYIVKTTKSAHSAGAIKRKIEDETRTCKS